MRPRKRKFMYGVFLAILLLVTLGLYCLGVREAQYHCVICGSKKYVETLRQPGWYALPELYHTEKTTVTLSPFYKDFLSGSDHVHKWDCDWQASKYFGQTYVGSDIGPPCLVIFYNDKPKFRKYVQQLIRDGEYTREGILELIKPGNEKRAEFLINDFMFETHRDGQ